MYNLHLTPEQLEMRDTVRDFVQNEIRPVTLHPSRLEPFAKPLLTDLLGSASKMGLRTLTLSEENGGAGADQLTTAIVLEELAQGDPDIACVIANTAIVAGMVFNQLASAEQRSRFLPQYLDDHDFHLAFAAPDPQSGLVALYHRPGTASAPNSVAAVEEGKALVLNGEIPAVMNAPIAKLFAIAVSTSGGSGTRIALVPRDTPGLTIQDTKAARAAASDRPKVAFHHGAAGTVTLRNCRVPASLVAPDDGAAAVAAYSARSSIQLSAANIGVGQAAFEAAIEYAKLRRQGGRPIIEHQPIGDLLAQAAIHLEASRDLVWKAAWTLDHPDAVSDRSVTGLPLHHVAHAFTADMMVKVTERSAECFGAMGVMRDMPLQKYVNDALVFKHMGLNPNATRLLIAERIAGFERNQR